MPTARSRRVSGSTQPETKAISATITTANGPMALLDNPQVVFTNEPASAGASSISVNPDVVSTDNVVLVSVYVSDVSNRPLVGEAVTFSSSGAGTWTGNPNTTDPTGHTQAVYHATQAGNQNLVASFGGVSLQTSLSVLPGHASSTVSTLSLSPNVLYAYGTASTLMLTLRDSYGNPLDGNTVTWSALPNSNNTITPATSTTDVNGHGIATFTASAAQVTTVSATVAGFTLQGNITVHSPPTSGTCSMTVNPNSAAADGTSAVTFMVHVNTGDGVAAANQNVVVSSSDRGAAFHPASGQTNSAGAFTFTMTSTYAGLQRAQAVVDGVTLSQNVTFIAPVCNNTLLFPGMPLVPATASPTAVAVNDFNGDTQQDLAVLLDTNTVAVYLGVGTGTFSAAITTPLPNPATTLVTAPFSTFVNNYNDLVVADTQGFQYLLGNNDGTFTNANANALMPIHNSPQLAFVEFTPPIVSTLLLQSVNGAIGISTRDQGIFAATATFTAGGPSAGSSSFTVGDFNNDGWQDVMVSNTNGGGNGGALAFLAGTGNATTPLSAPVVVGLGASNTAPSFVLSGYLNSDAYVDSRGSRKRHQPSGCALGPRQRNLWGTHHVAWAEQHFDFGGPGRPEQRWSLELVVLRRYESHGCLLGQPQRHAAAHSQRGSGVGRHITACVVLPEQQRSLSERGASRQRWHGGECVVGRRQRYLSLHRCLRVHPPVARLTAWWLATWTAMAMRMSSCKRARGCGLTPTMATACSPLAPPAVAPTRRSFWQTFRAMVSQITWRFRWRHCCCHRHGQRRLRGRNHHNPSDLCRHIASGRRQS